MLRRRRKTGYISNIKYDSDKYFKIFLDTQATFRYYIKAVCKQHITYRGVAQVVERFVRDEEAASSSLVTPIDLR